MRALKRVDLLHGMTEHQMAKVADAVQVLKFPAKARVITKGTIGEEFFMIQSGSVVVTHIGETPARSSSCRRHAARRSCRARAPVVLQGRDARSGRLLWRARAVDGRAAPRNVFAKTDLTVLRDSAGRFRARPRAAEGAARAQRERSHHRGAPAPREFDRARARADRADASRRAARARRRHHQRGPGRVRRSTSSSRGAPRSSSTGWASARS